MALYFNLPSITPTTGGGGGSVNVSPLNITPTTSAQNFVPAAGNAYAPVNVSAVNASIDPNITSANIVNGCNILGVIGSASATAPKEVAKYVIDENGVAKVSDKDLTGAFNDIVKIEGGLLPSQPQPALYYAFYNTSVSGDVLFSNCTNVGQGGMTGTFYNTNITSINMPKLLECPSNSFNNAANNCKKITNVSFDNVTNAGSSAFNRAFYSAGDNNGFSASFRNLNYAGSNAFAYAFFRSNVKSINLDSLTTVSDHAFGSAFEGTTQLKNFSAPNLISISSYQNSSHFSGAFSNSGVEYISMPARKQLGASCFSTICRNCRDLISFDVGEILVPSSNSSVFNGAFENCVNFVNFHAIFYPYPNGLYGNTPSIFNNAFRNCSSLETLDLSSWGFATAADSSSYGVIGNMCCDCSNLTSVNLFLRRYAFDQYSGNAFKNCYNLKEIELTSLTNANISNGFRNVFASSYITNLSFPSICNAGNTCFVDMLKNVDDCTVHFPSSMESTMNSYSEVLSGFGGTNTTVLFDLPWVNEVSSPGNLTENGEMGGANFAVTSSSDTTNAYRVFNSDVNFWRAEQNATQENPQSIVFYTPNPTRLFLVQFTRPGTLFGGNWGHSAYNIYGSNDNSSWEIVNLIRGNEVFAGATTASEFGAQVICNSFYKYYKVEFTANRPGVQRIGYTGIEHNS